MKCIRIFDSVGALPKPYEDLFDDTSSGFFSSLPWFRNFVETVFLPCDRVRLYGVESDSPAGRPALVLPMRHEIPASGKITPRRLVALGNYYTPLFGPVPALSDGHSQEVLRLLISAIAADRPRWDIVDLHPLEEDSVLADMIAAFRDAGMMAASYFCFGNWYLEVNERSYHEYHDALPSRLKNTLRRKTERLTKAGRLHIRIVTGGKDLTEAIAAFEQIYRASWKTPEPYSRFIPGLIRTCAGQDCLRLGLAYIDGIPAAAQLWVVWNGVASIYKLAYDERFSAESVGSILTAQLMQHVIDIDKVRQVDFLSGDDSYKKDWMSHRRERRGIIAYNLRTPHGLLGATRQMGGMLWKRLANSRIG